jgi:hypothetical protein
MRHLTSEQFVDLAEGTRDEASVPHLLACEVCRRQLADLRLTMSAAGSPGSDVPEPSPLFWDHLSGRVRDGVANEAVPARAALFWSWPRVAIGAVAGAFAVALAVLGSYVAAPGIKTPTAPPPPVAQIAPLEPLGSPDDPSLGLVVQYGSTLEWDEIREQMAVSTHTGDMDETVGDLNGGERQELQRLLKEEMAQPSALEHLS